jgi:hypothetical protein
MLVLLELVLRFAPIVNGTYAADPRARWPLHTLIADSSYTYSAGWNAGNLHRGRINNFGYASPRDYRPGDSGIVVIGDSYIESLMNDYHETLQGELGRYLETEQNVMSFGMSGADLPHYLGTAQIISRHFSPTWAVVLITKGDYKDGFSADSGFYRWAPGRDPPIELVPEVTRSALVKFTRSLALVRYVRGNLAIQFGDLIHLHRAVGGGPAPGCSHQTLSPLDESLTARYIDALPRALNLLPARVILVFDTDRKVIYAGTPAAARAGRKATECPSVDELARNRLMELAAERGMRVIDSAPVFRRWYAITRQRVDFLPQDSHWNPVAHRLMAQAVAAVINESGSLANPEFAPPSTSCAAPPDPGRRVVAAR